MHQVQAEAVVGVGKPGSLVAVVEALLRHWGL